MVEVVWRPAPSLREEGSGLARINSLYTVARFLLPLIFIYSCIINGLMIIILINHEYGTRRHSSLSLGYAAVKKQQLDI